MRPAPLWQGGGMPTTEPLTTDPSLLHLLLEARTWRAFDVDDAGRVLAGHDESGSVQLVELAPDGSRTDLTALPGACTGRYLPQERTVVVQHDNGGDENGQLSLLRLDPLPGKPLGLDDLEPLVHAEGIMHRLLDVQPGRVVYATNRRNHVDFDVLVREVATGREVVVYDAGGMTSETAVDEAGRRAAVAMVSSKAMSNYVLLAGVEDGTDRAPVQELTEPDRQARHERVRWTPDGSALVVTTDRDRDTAGVARVDVSSGAWSWLVTDEGYDVSGWLSPDGRLLLAETSVDGESRLTLHDAATGEGLREVELPGGGTPAAGVVTFPMPDPVWSPDSRFVALSFSAPTVPADVLLLEADTGRVRALTDSAEPLREADLVTPTSHLVPTPDGEQVPCFLYPPPSDAEEALAGSSVLLVHGGPEGQSVRSFNPVVQGMAGQGHTVLVPNVRGSTGYGKRWYSLDDVRLRLDSVADLAALHAWLPSVGLDQGRAALYGGSYGGYMVLAGLTFQPGLWAAGVDIVGISSLVTFLENTSPYRRAAREREYGTLERDREFLHEASPLNRIEAVRAPLFLIHGANDPRVPLSEAEQLAAAVRERGLECEMLVYDDEGHGLAKRANRLDAYPKALAFLARHLH
jgi:prolyl oligopeptidase PreP (S9A serine peptidase family)